MDATLHVRLAAAHAESYTIDVGVFVQGDGVPVVTIDLDPDFNHGNRTFLQFDPERWERFKRAIAEADKGIEQLRAKGVVFDV